jgi:sugar lactone lactonase YvrE
MDLLFITTAARNIDLETHPKAGGLFCVQTAVRGLLSPAFVLS